jgi:hypothetical protein
MMDSSKDTSMKTDADTASPTLAAASPAPRSRRGRTWFTVVLCAVIFLAGGVVGAGGTLIRIGRQTREAIAHPEALPHRIALRLQSRLDLTDEQTARVEQVILRRQGRILETLQNVDPEIDALELEIAELLHPAQADVFAARFRQFRDDYLPPRIVRAARQAEREAGRAPERNAERGAGRDPDRAEPVPERSPERSPERAPDEAAEPPDTGTEDSPPR